MPFRGHPSVSNTRLVDLADVEAGAQPAHNTLSRHDISARRWQMHTVAVIAVLIDIASKSWAVADLSDGSRIDGPLGSSLRLVHNTGSAFSLGEGLGPLFGVLAVAVSISLFWVVRQVEDRWVVFGLGLVQGGAIGNVIDRLFRDGDRFLGGAVIDFLEIADFWPVFNLADVSIVVGGALVVIAGSRE